MCNKHLPIVHCSLSPWDFKEKYALKVSNFPPRPNSTLSVTIA